MNRHVPVLAAEVVRAFASAPKGTVLDGTLGGGGHTRLLLEAYPELQVLACDRDPSAIAVARETLADFCDRNRLAFFNGNFSDIVGPGATNPPGFAPPWSGALLDLGYSSNQLEDAAYGMSFSIDGPLDMRLSRDGDTAWDLLVDASEGELASILESYGEARGAGRLARRIKGAIADGSLVDSTLSLASLMEKLELRRGKAIHPATLVFQALRIAVNDELRALDHFLDHVIIRLKPSAVLAVITFHSLEDRLVKQWGQKHQTATTPGQARLNPLTRKPVTATAAETDANPRARSAKLRVYQVT